ncbi:hypothetical protein EBB05_19210 [Methylobacterium brachiatum]|nr:hypothetical protein EBB05_19210 [Methylobacterium brachiatum]
MTTRHSGGSSRQILVVDDLDGRIAEDFAVGMRLRVQALRGSEGAATVFRRLELGSPFDRFRVRHAASFERCREERLLRCILRQTRQHR